MLTWYTQELEEVRAAHAEVQVEVAGLQQDVEDAKIVHTKALEVAHVAHAEVQRELGVLQQEGEDATRMHSKELEEVRAALAEVHGQVAGLQQEVEDGARLHSEARALQNELEMQLQGAQSTISALGKVGTRSHVSTCLGAA